MVLLERERPVERGDRLGINHELDCARLTWNTTDETSLICFDERVSSRVASNPIKHSAGVMDDFTQRCLLRSEAALGIDSSQRRHKCLMRCNREKCLLTLKALGCYREGEHGAFFESWVTVS